MTETGMLLSNKYRGERNPGFVGYPLPGVSAKLKDGGENSASNSASCKKLSVPQDSTVSVKVLVTVNTRIWSHCWIQCSICKIA